MEESAGSRAWAGSARLAALGITMIGVALRLAYLGRHSFWLDEATSVYIVQRSWSDFWQVISHREANMVFYYLLLRGWLHLAHGDAAVRLLSVIPAAATIPLVYGLGARLFGLRAGLVAALLLAVHPEHVAYSQEARGYSLVVFLVTLCWWFLVRWQEAGSARDAAGFVVSSVLAVYTHFFAALALVAQGAALIFIKPVDRKQLLISGVAAALLISPAIVFVLTSNVGQIGWVPALSARAILHLGYFLTGNGIRLALFAVMWAVAVMSASQPQRWGVRLCLLWLLAPAAMVIALSLWRPLLLPRFLLFCVPAAMLLAGCGLAQIRAASLRTALVVLMAGLSLASVRTYYEKPKDDWRGLVAYALSHAAPGDAILFHVSYGDIPFDYYESQHAGTAQPQRAQLDGVLQGQQAAYPRMWLVLFRTDDKDPTYMRLSQALATQYGSRQRYDFAGLNLVLYSGRSNR